MDNLLPNPERRWKRLASVPTVDDAFLDHYLAPWPELRRRDWIPINEGLRSLNLQSDELVLRVALADDHDLGKESAVLQYVPSAVRVPQLLDESDQALLLEYVPVEDLPASEEVGYHVGQAAKAIHGHHFPHFGFFEKDFHIDQPAVSFVPLMTDWLEQQLPKASLHDRPLLDQVWNHWQEHAPRLASLNSTPTLVHSDFKPSNVKWSAKEKSVVVFDWEFAWAGPPMFDLGQFFRWNLPSSFRRGFERGYGNDLTDHWQLDVELFDLLNLANFVIRGADDLIRYREVTDRMKQTLTRTH